MVGSLQYTRPDVAFSVNQLWQHMLSLSLLPSKESFASSSTLLTMGCSTPKEVLLCKTFVTPIWLTTRMIGTLLQGFGVFLSNCLVSWSANKQAVVSQSSTEVEYRAPTSRSTRRILEKGAYFKFLRLLYQDKGSNGTKFFLNF